MRVVVVGASSGLGRSIAVGLTRRGARTALAARRKDRLQGAVAEAGPTAFAVPCDVTEPRSCRDAVEQAAEKLGGIDALIYASAVGPLSRLVDTSAETWRRVLDTNVVGASLMTAAAVPYLTESSGTAVYLSSNSASMTRPWPGLGAYIVSKAALDKMVDAWREEHPTVGFTRLIVGECIGGDGDSMSGFSSEWDPELAGTLGIEWIEGKYMSGSFVGIEDLIAVVDSLLRNGGGVCMPTVTVTPRLQPSPVPGPGAPAG